MYSGNSTNNKSKFLNFFIERDSEAYKLQLNDLFKMCAKKIKPRANFEDCRKSLVLAQKAIESTKSRKFEKIILI